MEPIAQQPFVPCLPESAPFTPEQRAYLNGFLAGLFSRASAPAEGMSPGAPAPLVPLSILFGSQTGNAENLAKRAAREAGKRGFAPTVHDLGKYPCTQLASESRLLIITSTYGDGEPPDNARGFWNSLNHPDAPKLVQTRFAVCALGDSNYPKFCGFGKDLDARLETLGACRVHSRADCDVDFEEPFAKWLDGALARMVRSADGAEEPAGVAAPRSRPGGSESVSARAHSASPQIHERPPRPVPLPLGEGEGARRAGEGALPETRLRSLVSGDSAPARMMAVSAYSRTNPFPATLITNRRLNADGSDKDTRHFEIAFDLSALSYEVGDALGVFPTHCPGLAEEIIRALGGSGEEPVAGRDGAEVPLREALLAHYEITRIPRPLLEAVAKRSGDGALGRLIGPEVNGELTKFLWGREIIDLLLAHPAAKFTPAEFIGLLRKLQPRLYSIASSPKAHPGGAHLTVNIVRYESLSRQRKGVCSTFLAERAGADAPVPVFVQPNANFRPAGGETPIIMIGPGTGIAPFRAFLQERRATGARGRNWLFFGDQHEATDFLYRDELEAMRRGGLLTRLDTAFSRDQAEKVYVQHRMREQAKDMFEWLEGGAHFYVCGDANRMAKDVDAALHEVIQTAGGRTDEQAKEYVERLRAEKRYQRDVY